MSSCKHDLSSGRRLSNSDGNVFVRVKEFTNQERMMTIIPNRRGLSPFPRSRRLLPLLEQDPLSL
jgi:hypothetical protein